MIRPEQIPEEAWHAFKRYVLEHPYGYDYRDALAAALNAWQGAWTEGWATPHIILPLPAEVSDE